MLVAGRGRAEAFEVLLVTRRGERVQQAAVERRLEADDLVALGLAVHELILADQLDAALDRLGARVAEEHRVGERILDQPLGQLLAVADAEQVRGVPELAALLGQSLDQSGMAVAQRVHGDAGGKVQVTSAVRRVEIVALSAFEHDVLATVRRHHSRNHDRPPPKSKKPSPDRCFRAGNTVFWRGGGTIGPRSGCVNLAHRRRGSP